MSVKSAVKRVPFVGPLARVIGRSFAHSRFGIMISTLGKLRGVHPRTCSICGFEGRFLAFGNPPRWDAKCPRCDSLERHRLLAIYLREHPTAIGGRVIHFAPETGVAKLIRPLARQYQSADLFMEGCDLALDLEEIALPDKSVDVFVASHILEHVNDSKALAELFRCLRPGGTAIIMVPIVESWRTSYENQAVTSEREREVHFGQFDHVRYYGADLRDRIRHAGFQLEEYTAHPVQCVKYGLQRGETIFLARRAG